jgi:2-C-methyl-D-erythritol 4-phosphate cytidylyltransferase / 2-C-methyl-D-erythritol 2,4-cyclodiphosphate synthase
MHVTAIIAAGGRGERFGAGRPKQLHDIDGRSILERSVRLFLEHPAIDDVIVVLPPELAVAPPFAVGQAKALRVVAGGVRRQDSVANAFAAVPRHAELVVIHDAARPFASADLIARTIEAAAQSGAALAALPARDTVKRAASRPSHVEDSGQAGTGRHVLVLETLPRETVYLAQTPQAFRRELLQAALEFAAREGIEATDEATLVERAGHQVRLVTGEETNIKITVPEDLPIAGAIAGRSAPSAARAGVGYDIHRLVEGRPLVLGGVTIPFDRGLLGYSDADAVCHAITDAILGAAAAGDIGRHFPNDQTAWRDASSIDLLRRAAAVVHAHGFEVANVDASVIAERPKLGPYIDTMRRNLAAALGVDLARVSVKGKTNDGVGELGRGEAIAVHATALLYAR